MSDLNAISALENHRVIHRIAYADKSTLSFAQLPGEFYRTDSRHIISVIGTTSGLSCSNKCCSAFSTTRHIYPLDAILMHHHDKEGNCWRVYEEDNYVVIVPPPTTATDESPPHDVQFEIIYCYNLPLPVYQQGESYVDLNDFFYFQWDNNNTEQSSDGDLLLLHGAIHLKDDVALSPDAIPKLFERSRTGTGIKFLSSCFNVEEWRPCQPRFVQFPHSLHQHIMSSQEGKQFEINNDLFLILCNLFNYACKKNMIDKMDEVDRLLGKYLCDEFLCHSDIESIDNLVNLFGDERMLQVWKVKRSSILK